MKKQKGILIAISLLLHLAILALAFDTTEIESSRVVQPAQSGLQPVKESEKKESVTHTDEAKWNSNSVKISMYREDLPGVVVEQEFVASLKEGMLLVVILSAGFHTTAFLKLKGSNKSMEEQPIQPPCD
tara:strand:+ start:547 stop:933 length:387 start_codon:yes stop_codon:yes gene_type:complete